MKKHFILVGMIALWTNILAQPGNDKISTDSFLNKLAGTWTAKGTSFGKPSDITMKWEWTLRNKFFRINYKLAMFNENNTTSEFEGTGFYSIAGDKKYKGTWFDSSGDMHPISAIDDGTMLTSTWGTEGVKMGKSTYRLFENKVEVVDYIQLADKSWKEFNRNILVKQ